MPRDKLTPHDRELLTEVVERGLLDGFIDGAEARLFADFKNGDVEARRHVGYALDALKVLGQEIKSSINEAIRHGRDERTGSSRAA